MHDKVMYTAFHLVWVSLFDTGSGNSNTAGYGRTETPSHAKQYINMLNNSRDFFMAVSTRPSS